MIYVSWAALYEGKTEQAYFEILIPRLMEEIVLTRGIRSATIPPAPAIRLRRRGVQQVAREACEAKDAFHLVFIHADAGGRRLEAAIEGRSTSYCEAMHAFRALSLARCIVIAPRHETEAWILADPRAVADALGYRGSPNSIRLPASPMDAERLSDPKAVLAAAVRDVRGNRRPINLMQIIPAIALRQSMSSLRQAPSFRGFEENLVDALIDLGCVSSST